VLFLEVSKENRSRLCGLFAWLKQAVVYRPLRMGKRKNQNMLKNSKDASKGIETAKKGILAIVLF
jgi:hypothetical protein